MREEISRARELMMKCKCHIKGHDWSKFKEDPSRGPRIMYQYCKRCRVGRIDFKLSLERSERTIEKYQAAIKSLIEAFSTHDRIKELDKDFTYHVEVDCDGLDQRQTWEIIKKASEVLHEVKIKGVISSKGMFKFQDQHLNICPRWQCGGLMKQVEEDDWQTPALKCENCNGKYRFVEE